MRKTVFGEEAPAPRPTKLSAALVALVCAAPIGGMIWFADLVWF